MRPAVRIERLPDIEERDMSGLVSGEKKRETFQELLFTLQRFWAVLRMRVAAAV